jgi:hypothetical protein
VIIEFLKSIYISFQKQYKTLNERMTDLSLTVKIFIIIMPYKAARPLYIKYAKKYTSVAQTGTHEQELILIGCGN